MEPSKSMFDAVSTTVLQYSQFLIWNQETQKSAATPTGLIPTYWTYKSLPPQKPSENSHN